MTDDRIWEESSVAGRCEILRHEIAKIREALK